MILWIILELLKAEAEKCEPLSPHNLKILIVSDSNTLYRRADNQEWTKAKECQKEGAWTANILWAKWIWDAQCSQNSETIVFENKFAILGIPTAATLRIACDNESSVTINGDDAKCNVSSFSAGSEKNCSVSNYLKPGMNTAKFTVINGGGPGGLLYLIDISANVG